MGAVHPQVGAGFPENLWREPRPPGARTFLSNADEGRITLNPRPGISGPMQKEDRAIGAGGIPPWVVAKPINDGP